MKRLTHLLAFAALAFPLVGMGAYQDEPSVESLVRDLQSTDSAKRINAAAELTKHVDQLPEFLLPLANLFTTQDEQLRLVAERAFHRMGASAVQPIAVLLESDELREFQMGCDAIRSIGDPAKDRWKPFLLEKMNSDDRYIRVATMHALTGFSDGAPEIVDKVVEHFGDPNFNVDLFACRLLIKTGREAREAVPALAEMIENGNVSQRSYAAMALGAIGPTDQYDTLDTLEGMLQQFSYFERERALTALGLYGAEAQRLEDAVVEKMNQDGSNLEARAAYALWQITGEPQRSVDRLIELSKRPEFEITALEFIRDMGPAANSAADYLVERLAAPDESVRDLAAQGLGAIGDLSDDQKSALEKAQKDSNALVRLSAQVALEKLEANASGK